MKVHVPCHKACYQNLWYEEKNQRQQLENNIEFYMHADALRHHIGSQSGIAAKIVQQYRNVIKFIAWAHHFHIQT